MTETKSESGEVCGPALDDIGDSEVLPPAAPAIKAAMELEPDRLYTFKK